MSDKQGYAHLTAEIAAAEAERDEKDKQLAQCYDRMCHLERELAAAQKDAERYRWLRARPVEDCTTPRIEVNAWDCNVNDDGVSDSVNDGNVLAGDALDAAIDAAMKECGK